MKTLGTQSVPSQPAQSKNSSVKPRARLLSKELLLAFAKMIYPVHVSQAILNSKTTDFLVALHFLIFFVQIDNQQRLFDV